MSRFLSLVAFEVAYYMRRISTHVYFVIFAFLAGFMAMATGGAFEQIAVGIGGGGGIMKVNSPYVVFGLIHGLSLFGVIVVAAIAGNAVHRDYAANMHPLVFTSPITKLEYLGSRFVGTVIVNTYVMLGLAVGLAIGFAMPGLEKDALGPSSLVSYLYPYAVAIVPNVIFIGAVFFALAAFTRQMLPNYLGGVVMLGGYTVAGIVAQNVERLTLAALVDPFGGFAMEVVTRYWTAADRNVRFVPFEGLFLANRLIWLAAGALVFLAVYRKFSFRHLATERMESGRARRDWEERSSEYHGALARRQGLADAPRSFGLGAAVVQCASVMKRAYASIVTNVYFYAIVAFGVFILAVAASQANKLYGTSPWPVTYQMIGILAGSFGLFMIIIITFYAGELVWQERERNLHQVHDSLPMPTWVPFVGKVGALVLVVVTLQAALMAFGILLQAGRGYYKFEPLLYVKQLFGIQLVNWTLMIVLIVLIQALVNSKYLGYFLVILYFVGRGFLGRFGLEHVLYRFGDSPGVMYSDMNLFGPFLGPHFWVMAYWAGVALVMAVLSNLFWVRGEEWGAQWRVFLARQRYRGPAVLFTAAGVVIALVTGAFVFWNTNVRNEYRTTFEQQAIQARYEREYGQFEDLPQPRITAASVDVTLWPKEQRGRLKGRLEAINKTSEAIPAVHVQLPPTAKIGELTFDPPATETKRDEEIGYFIWTLAEPLAPGAKLALSFDLSYAPEGFSNEGASTQIVENGTFINSGLVPSFGYSPNGELGDDDTRKKHGLEPKERAAPVDDLKARMNTYISRDSDWIDFESVVCTDPDQLAIAPGYLQEEFMRDDRRCFRYVMDAPILNFYSFLSARYTVVKDSWNDVAIEVWHHPGHEYNVKRMIDATKKSLAYYTKHFTPYQHRQVRIVEFPRYASFAQSFPNTIPYSESIGFIARVRNPEKDLDYPFWVTAHEVAHQWFAHQVIGGAVQGATLLSESLSQYASLKVLEEEYGQRSMVRFLKYDRDQYLTMRSTERKKELPLLLVENQQYIHYNKGAVVLYSLSEHVGAERFNGAIKRYLEKTRFQEPPYTNSLELLAELRAVTPPDLQYLLDDMMSSITLYDIRATSATAERLADDQWKVVLEIEAKKLRADETGLEVEVPMNDLVDVGAFKTSKGTNLEDLEPLVVERRRLASGKHEVTFVTASRPDRAGVNHRLLLLDRDQKDDIIAVKDAKVPAS